MTFKKLVAFTDLHLGKRNNSDTHNQDCMDYIEWMIEQGKNFGAEICVMSGDFHDVRASLNVKTMNYSIAALQNLSKSFKDVYFVLGNHDIYHRERIDIHSLKYANLISNIHIIDKPTVVGDITFVPWIVDRDYTPLQNAKTRYVFSHLELPNFFMNSMNVMPDNGHANAEMFDGPQYVFSGHFHKRQVYKNSKGSEIIYIGNCFPHNYSDVNDSERGCMLLENGGEPMFINWTDCPKYKLSSMSQMIDNPETVLDSKTYVRIENDMDLRYDELSFIKDTLQKHFQAREIVLLPKRSDDALHNFQGKDTSFKSVDHIVLSHLDALDTSTFDKKLLSDIYLGL